MPAEQRIEQSADQRRNHRRDRHGAGDQTDHLRRTLAAEQVANDGAADGDAGRAADRLQKRMRRSDRAHSTSRWRRGLRRSRAQIRTRITGGGRSGRTTGRCRSCANARPEHVERDRELDRLRVARQHLDQPRHRRHQNVERHRADGGHRHQQRKQPPRRRAVVVQGGLWLVVWVGPRRGRSASRQRARRRFKPVAVALSTQRR